MSENLEVQARLETNVRLLDERVDFARYRELLDSGEAYEVHGPALGILAAGLPLYCSQLSKHYRSAELLPILEDAADALLAVQHENGSVSSINCNIESPPDASFAAHSAALVAQVGRRFGPPELAGVTEKVVLFLTRMQPSLLTGGIHTPNHRWVMAAALAKMEELFGGTAFRERAFEFLNEGLDITEYGEWTERSNAVYNSICAFYLYSVGKTFDYKPALDASRSTLRMMRYLLHSDETIATEYSGRQDRNEIARFNDWYAVSFRLLANHYGDAELAEMARVAERHTPAGTSQLLYLMLEPENMALPESGDQAPDQYTILFGGDRTVPVQQDNPYRRHTWGHPHGASVLRHRRGKLSVTAMAAQPELLYVQYGEARLLSLKLSAGWFGIAGVSFPGIRAISEDHYRAEILLKGSYYQPLPEHLYRDAKGSYVDMPNHLRERTDVVELELAVEFRLLDDGVDLRIISTNRKNAYLQAAMAFDSKGELTGEGLAEVGPMQCMLKSGAIVYKAGEDWIRVEEGAYEHKDHLLRNDTLRHGALNAAINLKTPTDRWIRIRCGGA